MVKSAVSLLVIKFTTVITPISMSIVICIMIVSLSVSYSGIHIVGVHLTTSVTSSTSRVVSVISLTNDDNVNRGIVTIQDFPGVY